MREYIAGLWPEDCVDVDVKFSSVEEACPAFTAGEIHVPKVEHAIQP